MNIMRGMSNATFKASDPESLATNPNQNTGAGTRSNGAGHSPASYFDDLDPSGIADPRLLTERTCHSAVSGQAVDHSPCKRELFGGKGMFLWRMKAAGLSVPPFECVTAQVMNALEQHPLDTPLLDHYFPGFVDEPLAETSLRNIREYLNTLPPSEQTKRDEWLSGLAEFIASDDYYQQVKDSEAAQQIRALRCQLDDVSRSQPVIVRSSGINEDNYGDAQAGKYLSLVQEEEDVLTTCLKVMASAYRPEVCSEGIPQPMALVIQQCIDCQYGGVAMSFQSFQDNTVRVEYTPGQPRGVVAGQSGNTPHRIDIYRGDRKEEACSSQYFPGTFSSHFILYKNNNGYSEITIENVDAQSDDGGQELSDQMITRLRDVVTILESLLFCPVDVEFAIDHQGQLFLLQVRPVTRLSGGMDFAMPVPEETLAIGEGVSEGFCTGPLWLAKQQEAESMPHGAIVVAHHAEEWMLKPEFLERAGGFFMAEGGFNDHVAILMKQKGKTLMLAGEKFAAVAAGGGQQATLACARFKGKPGAFIVSGDLTGKLASYRSLTSAFSDVPSHKAVPSRDDLSPPEGAFLKVASGFQWLTDQNARLLSFFASGSGLDCLANPIKLSMSPQRTKILEEIRDTVNRLVYGAEKLLDGYRAFLSLAGNSDSPQLQSLQEELPQLSNRFETLKRIIRSELKRFILPVQTTEKGQISPVIFSKWVTDCHQLQSCLQALDPGKAEQVRSVHELIFALHQRFVKGLAPVAMASGQGNLTSKRGINYVDCSIPGEKTPILMPSLRALMEELRLSGTVIIMNEASIVNLDLGSHVGVIELLECAEGGKGRTLRLTFSDQFDRPDDRDKSGKFRRMWFLAQLLKEIKLDQNADSMKLSCNAVAGEIIVECPRMKLSETMRNAFQKLIIVLRAMYNMDIRLKCSPIFEGGQWDFNLLAQRLNCDIATDADRFAFQHCLFVMFYWLRGGRYTTAAFCSLLSNHHQQFTHHARRLGAHQWSLFFNQEPEESLQDIFMTEEMSEDIRRELLHHFLLFEPKSATRLVEQVYDLGDQYFVINPSFSHELEFYAAPGQPLGDHKEKLRNALLKHGLEYASQRVWNDKDFVLAVISKYPMELRYLNEVLRNDRDIVMAAVAESPGVLCYAGEGLRSDKDIIQLANGICR
ncbi:PEP/pyruvate-binding domain-containing protein [Endozoicomonas sp. 8E]|uniref:PEP/pyruvate-binding domain-containing protein n=1 Tax=Endozoicomonas sp. 8E TaxID=3035692 RepID=UPI0029390853|nr:PEP/pyruvate-binding domain-containing protein [Endozoicomonas sp. 8E]WOG25643.1 PEP/pyruvate-binding domain-containing protein [Endozoicomonas sp. 8E]